MARPDGDGALEQMMRDVRWGELDVMVVDMPPGTGDTQLTMTQRVPVRRRDRLDAAGHRADRRAQGPGHVPQGRCAVLGIIENMSTFICPNCGHEEHIFGHGGAKLDATRLATEFLGEIPLDIAIRITLGRGQADRALAAQEQTRIGLSGDRQTALGKNCKRRISRAADRGKIRPARGRMRGPDWRLLGEGALTPP